MPDALKIIGTAALGSGVGWWAGIGLAMRDMTPDKMFHPFIGAFVGGAVGVVVGAVVFA